LEKSKNIEIERLEFINLVTKELNKVAEAKRVVEKYLDDVRHSNEVLDLKKELMYKEADRLRADLQLREVQLKAAAKDAEHGLDLGKLKHALTEEKDRNWWKEQDWAADRAELRQWRKWDRKS
jgi:uncharacterized protein YifE (UPF0438 family)